MPWQNLGMQTPPGSHRNPRVPFRRDLMDISDDEGNQSDGVISNPGSDIVNEAASEIGIVTGDGDMFKVLWGRSIRRWGESLAENPYVDLVRDVPTEVPAAQRDDAYKLLALFGTMVCFFFNRTLNIPLQRRDDELAHARANAIILVWIAEYCMHVIEDCRRRLINDNDVPLSDGPRFVIPPKKSQEAHGDDANEHAAEEARENRGRGIKISIYEPECTNITPQLIRTIMGKHVHGLPIRIRTIWGGQQKYTDDWDETMSHDFVSALMSIKGNNNVRARTEKRNLQPEHARRCFQWFVKIFSDDGHKRLDAVVRQSKAKTCSMDIAAQRLGAFARKEEHEEPVPPIFIELAQDMSEAIEADSQKRFTEWNDFRSHVKLAKVGSRVEEIKRGLNTRPPPAELANFLRKLRTEYPQGKGQGNTTLYHLWLCDHAQVKGATTMAKMRGLLDDARIFNELRNTFGEGIFLFVPRSFGAVFKNTAVSCRPKMFKKFNQFWQIKETCEKAMEVIGTPVLERLEVSNVYVDAKQTRFEYLGDLPPYEVDANGEDVQR